MGEGQYGAFTHQLQVPIIQKGSGGVGKQAVGACCAANSRSNLTSHHRLCQRVGRGGRGSHAELAR